MAQTRLYAVFRRADEDEDGRLSTPHPFWFLLEALRPSLCWMRAFEAGRCESDNSTKVETRATAGHQESIAHLSPSKPGAVMNGTFVRDRTAADRTSFFGHYVCRLS